MAFKEPNFIHALLMSFAGDVLARSVYKKRIESLNLKWLECFEKDRLIDRD